MPIPTILDQIRAVASHLEAAGYELRALAGILDRADRGNVARSRSIPLDDMELSTRTANCLRSAGLQTLGDVADKTRTELLKIDNFGRISLREITDVLENYNLKLKAE